MSEERFTTLEKTIASLRNDFLQAIVENTRSMSILNKVILQQEENARDANHEITILTGVVGSQGRDIKAIKDRLDGFDLQLASQGQDIQEIKNHMDGFDLQLASQGRDISSQGQDIKDVKSRMTSLEGKLDRVLQILTPPRTD